MNWTKEQARVIGTWGKGLAVWAGAGSGKTSTLVAKCLELLRRDPRARFAIASFTERSAHDLRAKLEAVLGPTEILRHRVGTLHGLCRSIVTEFPPGELTGDERILDPTESEVLWRSVLDRFWLDPTLGAELHAARIEITTTRSRESAERAIERMKREVHLGAKPEGAWAVVWSVIDRLWTARKRAAQVLEFDDLERVARAALEQFEVRTFFHRRYDLVLVDEFQDTSAVQAEILRLFARPDASNLVVVGDPKQSIYRFRNADVRVFEAECERLPERVILSDNFRSVAPIVEFVNRVCEPVFQKSGLNYLPLLARREGEGGVGEVRVSSPEEFGRNLESLQHKNVLQGTQAVLLPRIRGAEAWVSAVQAAGFQNMSGAFFWASPLVQELACALRFWIQPENELSGVGFLRAPWVFAIDEALDEILMVRPEVKRSRTRLRDGLASSADPVLTKWHSILKQHPPTARRPGEVVLEILEAFPPPPGERAEALKLWHWLEDRSYAGESSAEIVACLDRKLKANHREKSEIAGDLPARVLLTVHAAKGLEFDHVFLADLGPHRAPRKDSFDEPTDDEKNVEKAADLAESKRGFYVALTRAKKTLWLITDAARVLEPGKGGEDWEAWIRTYGGLDIALPSGQASPDANVFTLGTPSAELRTKPV